MDAQLARLCKEIRSTTLSRLFEANPNRFQDFSFEMQGLFVDFSKNHITSEILKHLIAFCNTQGLTEAICDLFNGACINNTEQRPALHTVLRDPSRMGSRHHDVHEVLEKMDKLVEGVHRQKHLGYSGKPISDIVNIGIGGSDLGPRMVTQALKAFHHHSVRVHFVSNIDGADLADTLEILSPETTLFIVASKSFSTLETRCNALAAKQWVCQFGCDETNIHRHFVATTSNVNAAKEFGIDAEHIFPMWDWVGGRFSLWSAIGLPIAIAIGMQGFRELLTGAHQMDQHFKTSALDKNLPVIAACIWHWYQRYWKAQTQAVMPYAHRLNQLPAYLQQLDMESLGKSVSREGDAVSHPTGTVIWGAEGSNGQHSFLQLLHQGTQIIPIDFIAVKQSMSPYIDSHQHLLACCLAQSQALLEGKTLKQVQMEMKKQGLTAEEILRLAPHKVISGNKPSTLILMDSFCPQTLGQLLAFYEHKVFASSVLLNINAFDQWGVELGKLLSGPIYSALTTENIHLQCDPSTQNWVRQLKT